MLAVGAVLVHGVPACLSDGDPDGKLNPQPLPPGDPPEPFPSDGLDNGSGSAGPPPTSGTGDAATAGDADAADDGDADGAR